ncbi:MAG: UDP-N-acetylglucosamine 2-epimerase (non-hydrolyzing) [Gemmatimonadetes bacterium]|nr:UDP-N-acetylglucosamine 2-epimerase (non-hydrolyzing) [Gemmatimonadota bacterium]
MTRSNPRVLVIAGTRPEGIKLAPVLDALRVHGEAVDVRLALTGQHTTLIRQVLDVFGLEASWDLAIMKEGQDLYDIAHGCLDGLRDVVREFRPDMLLVQGDTASVFFGALVGFFERVRVGHVEAGLRSGDRQHPYPEEMLRRMTGVVADVHFAPTPHAAHNLLAENVDAATVYLTGNTVVDAVQRIASIPHEPEDSALREVLAGGGRLVLVTAHRRESFGEPLREAFGALREIADGFEDVTLVYPVHPNPNVREPAEAMLGGHPRIRLTAPLDYLDLVHALKHAALVITDSGGIQEEAPSFGTPVLVLRDVTERPEAVEAGIARLVGTDRRRIVEAASEVLRSSTRAAVSSPYGDGRAGERIADIVMHTLTGAARVTEDWRP